MQVIEAEVHDFNTILVQETIQSVGIFRLKETEIRRRMCPSRESIAAQHLSWGGSKGVISFPWIFYCNAEFSPCWALPEYIRALIHLACFAGLFSDAMGYCLPIVSCETTRTK